MKSLTFFRGISPRFVAFALPEAYLKAQPALACLPVSC
ncbi:hypothetical protein TRICHSKD4_1144 [Roseibium sp. TrichSKD4]|nr:hypothetical protein TRICHSKD4_1144 [Roseibium sp. TrichSKD4]